jgi:hypothetical protein
VAAQELSGHERAVAMARRLVISAWRAGASERAAERLERAFLATVDFRATAVADAEDHRFLHPARTALILIDDAEVNDGDALAAATMVESIDRAVSPGAAWATAVAGAEAASLLAAVPLPADGAEDPDGHALLREQLVTAEPLACLVALAEQLDQARHLHLRLRPADLYGSGPTPDPALFLARVRAVYAPVAARVQPLLGRRLERWAGAFEARFLRGRR